MLHANIKERTSKTALSIPLVGEGNHRLVDFGYKKQYSVHHGKNDFARGNSPILTVLTLLGLC